MRSRFNSTFLLELRRTFRRPMLWILILALGLSAFGLSNGNLSISSGDSSVGGTKVWVTSQFNVALSLTFLVFLLYTFFVSVAAGMSVLSDDEARVGELLHSTPLRPKEYVWGKFLGIAVAFTAVLALHVALTILFYQIVPISRADEIRGPFALANYLLPAVLLAWPTILFFAGTAFAVGERTRRPIVVMVLPVAFVIASVFFLWNWAPTWLDPRINKLLMVLDPSGFRWLNETWLKLDRGAEFYNTQPIGWDLPFWINRLWILAFGFGAVAWTARRLAATLRADEPARRRWWRRKRRALTEPAEPPSEIGVATPDRPLSALDMRVAAPTLTRGILDVLRVELRELRSQPGLYLFVPLILLQTLGTSLAAVGAFGTPVLLTSGTLAVGTMNTLTLLVCLLLLFYTVESLERERSTGLASIFYATPLRSASILFGKALANSVVGIVILLATFLACALALLVQGGVRLELGPFLLVWGLLLVPTFLVWSSFVTALLAVVRERYTTYGLALAALIASGYFQATGKMTWVFNWNLWSAVRWSDMGSLELNRPALILNRLTALGLTVLFTAVAVQWFGRRDFDHGRLIHRLHPRHLWRGLLRAAPLLAIPLVTGGFLFHEVRHGFQGEIAEEKAKDYWRQNLATWRDAKRPSVVAIDVDVELEPEERAFAVQGSYRLFNHHDVEIRRLGFTTARSWQDRTWSLDGEPFVPEDRSGLFVFELPEPMQPGREVKVGFGHRGRHPDGITKNGGGTSQFILPSGVVLHIFAPTFLPLPGYVESIGVDDDNRYEPKKYEKDYYLEVIEPAFGNATPFTTRVRVTAPAEYTVNSVGTLVEESTDGDKKTVVWESDHPVKLLNLVAGKWDVRRKDGTAVFYHPEHTYNIDEISDALAAARRHYSEWFFPFPWRELKLSEFPNLASYAQGFPTNITFSEGIGFLTESDPKTNTAFLVTAHEAAHQWWGNILTPGDGPGGNILSEGMSHFSTILLMEAEKGERGRIELCRRLEERYEDSRQVDSERPLVEIDGSRAGDTTVTYDKGGWAMWMLSNLMGRQQALAGLQEFIREFERGPDHPLLQDMLETLRPYAPDPEAFDSFVEQWYFDVVVPEYRLSSHSVQEDGDGRWTIRVTITNDGEAKMPVVVAAQRGERFPDEEAKEPKPYSESRAEVVLEAGQSRELEWKSDFEPQRITVDPDAMVLQLRREAALIRL